MQPQIIKGDSYTDQRGTLRFVNGFDLKDVRRFYTIQHPDTSIVRAWQGHEIETKWFFPLKGSFVVAWVEIDDFGKPSENLKAEYKILKAIEPLVVHVPAGYANGLKALEPDSELMVFSSLTLKEAKTDDKRYPAEWWFDWGQF